MLSSIGLILFSVSFVLAQVLVKGTVKDNLGEGVPGASVQVQGTSQGTITDLDGKFAFNVPNKNSILVISFIGYVTVEIKADTQKPMVITLREDTKTLDEVVVVGYQEVRKRDLTGSVAKANISDLLSAPTASFDQSLGGRIAGVNVSSAEGMPGGQMNIVIRGNNSLTQDNSPLYVIDGFPIEDPMIASSINQNDIESIDVLKDASASAIYGARGANGVIVITTKKGKIGQPKLSYDGSFGIQHITKTIPMMDAYEFVKLQYEIQPDLVQKSTYLQLYNGKQWTLDDYRNIPQYNWQDEIFRSAWMQSHNFSLTGGSEGIRYNASLSYYDQDGIVINSNYKRMQGRMNTTINRKKLRASMTVNYSRSITTGNSPSQNSYSGMNNTFYSVWGYRPVTSPDTPLSYLKDNLIDESINISNDYRFNPYMDLKNAYRKNYINNLQFNGYVEYEFIKGLKLKVSGGYTYDARKNDTFNNSKTRYGNPTSADKINSEILRTERLTWLNENILTYQTNIKKKHYFNMLAGISFQNSDSETYSFRTVKIPQEYESIGIAGMGNGTPTTTTSLKTSWSMMSFPMRFGYNFKSKYYATASFRADGSSKFSGNNRFGYFPSGSVAWAFMEENFMESLKSIISSGKLRVSWGLTGNNRVGDYDTYAIYQRLKEKRGDYISLGSVPSGVYPFENDLTSVGVVPLSLRNRNLKWETTEQWNVGLDLGLFDERIGITMDWYHKITRDLLLDTPLAPSSGYFSAMKNIGKIRNQGFEFTLNTTNIKNKKFTWTSNFNIALNKNKVLELAENQTAMLSSAKFDQNYNSQSSYIAKVGYSMGTMYGFIYEGTYKYDDFDKVGNNYVLKRNIPHYTSENNTQPGMPKYADLNNDGVIDDNDRTMIGNGLPKHTGGFTNNFTYKGLDMNVFLQWSYGNDVLNANRLMFESSNNLARDLNQFASYADRWTPENPESNIPRATNSGSNRVFSSRIIEDGSFLRLKTVTLGYSLPQLLIKRWGIDKARVYVAAQNILTLSGYSGYDPEVSIREGALTPGLDFSAYPRAFSVSLGINLGF